jgi:predicted nucleotidyltransferase
MSDVSSLMSCCSSRVFFLSTFFDREFHENKGVVSMAEVPRGIMNLLREYVAELEKNNIHLETAILLGSYAKGDFGDIDIALVSDDFQGVRFLDKEKIRRLILSIDYRIDPLPYKTEDFTESNIFVKEILETGVKIV